MPEVPARRPAPSACPLSERPAAAGFTDVHGRPTILGNPTAQPVREHRPANGRSGVRRTAGRILAFAGGAFRALIGSTSRYWVDHAPAAWSSSAGQEPDLQHRGPKASAEANVSSDTGHRELEATCR